MSDEYLKCRTSYASSAHKAYLTGENSGESLREVDLRASPLRGKQGTWQARMDNLLDEDPGSELSEC